ncbi:MAG: nucleotidyltransferase family protein [Lewinella sp.]|nr:nucleotidyltransferase family protein [Lewinella sp.]
MTPPLAFLLLAAGAGSRMGMPKQLMVLDGQPLLLRTLATVRAAAGSAPVYVVLGARAAMIRPLLTDGPVGTVINPDWESGMASSLQAGLAAALADEPELGGVVLTVVDQPALTADHLRQLVQAWCEGSDLIGSVYADGGRGVPALIGAAHFPALRALTGAAGAGPLLRDPARKAHWIPFPEGHRDLDKPEDWENWRRK